MGDGTDEFLGAEDLWGGDVGTGGEVGGYKDAELAEAGLRMRSND